MEKIPIRHIKVSKKEPDLSEAFTIRDIDSLLAETDMVQELHRHDFFYLLIVKEGTGNHNIDFTSYNVSDYSVSLMRPGQVHQLVLEAGSTGYLIQFRKDFYSPHDKSVSQLLRKTSNINHYQFDSNKFQKLSAILSNIFQEYTDKQEKYLEVIKANMDIFFIELIRKHGSNPIQEKANLYIEAQLEAFLSHLETHVFSHKQVSEYAALLNLSTFQLNAITKTSLGKTCSEVINEYIILESKRYLLATSNQITQIAYYLGYEDVSYFIRFFKKHTGYTPDAFRHNFK
ncbi:AraC family transcriptional regulator [Arcicella aquatica]|uniref:AraC family transcriptional regulator n=1 Tax=Arcicella aquatica TaxID=217141 RepID=A0ABU5QJT5_9BACT|nr:AraC family transcriptional regulator [Arcicella aquatica]MEA5257303.1 AraC family transcriptional regulator [Arcicella aquatica]